jgi:hypothetical protein
MLKSIPFNSLPVGNRIHKYIITKHVKPEQRILVFQSISPSIAMPVFF